MRTLTLAIILTGCVTAHADDARFANTFNEFTAREVNDEALILAAREEAFDQSISRAQCAECDPTPQWWVTGGVRMTYLKVPGTDSVGVGENIRAGIPLGDSWVQAVGSFDANHLDGGTQALASVGLDWIPQALSPDAMDRIGVTAMVHHLWDWRYAGTLDVSFATLRVGYAFAPGLYAGISYWEPIGPTQNNPTIGNTAFGAIRQTRAVGLFVNRSFGSWFVGCRVQYRERYDTTAFGATIRRRIADFASAYVNADYEDRGTWSGSVGIEITFGGGDDPFWSRYTARRYVPTEELIALAEHHGNMTVRGGDLPDFFTLPFRMLIYATDEDLPVMFRWLASFVAAKDEAKRQPGGKKYEFYTEETAPPGHPLWVEQAIQGAASDMMMNGNGGYTPPEE